MGFNSVVFLLNDALDSICRTHGQEFLDQVYQRCASGGPVYRPVRDGEVGRIPEDFPVGSYCNYANVAAVHHADFTSVILAGGNYVTVLGTAYGHEHHTKDSVKRILNDVLDEYGLKVIEKKAPK